MSDSTAQTRSYICDQRFDDRAGSEWGNTYIPSIIYHAADVSVNWTQEAAADGRVKVTVLECTDFLDAGFMGAPGVRRATV